VASAACAGVALGVAVSSGAAGGPPGGPGQQPGTLVGPPSSPAFELNAPGHEVRAGDGAQVRGHSWFPSLTCTSPVKVTLVDSAGTRHGVGTVLPVDGAVTFDTDSKLKVGVQLANIRGGIRVPEAAATGRARVIGDQTLRFKFLFPPCLELATMRKTTHVEVKPSRYDSRVITDVSATAGARGTPVRLAWRLSRGGRARVRLEYLFTAQKVLDISTPLDAQRPAGAQALDVSTVLAGHPLPAGGYRLRVELIDPQGSALIPAAEKSTTFRLAP
jgi:hypothetical protein